MVALSSTMPGAGAGPRPRSTPSVAVLVTSSGRDEHLVRQQQALAAEPGWDEAVVCFIDQGDEPWQEPPARVRTLHLDGLGLNLAAARNAAAAASGAEVLVFLDVDCLPGPGSIAALVAACASGAGERRLVMADPHYLPPGWDPRRPARTQALPHPARAALGHGRSQQWHMFWSLGFAIRAEDFRAVGGFDEGFSGYGGEDTDFAFRCRDAGFALWLDAATVLHQPHAVHRPPLQHLESIVVNAHRFRERWGVWPMEGWLAEFARLGLVRWEEDQLELLRLPTGQELAASRVGEAAFG